LFYFILIIVKIRENNVGLLFFFPPKVLLCYFI
jgi:hypothetical protein